MPNEHVISKLQAWYASRCNGHWEHQWGVRIDTVDNPGWAVTIDLEQTEWEDVTWDEWRVDRGAGDWVHCRKEGKQFRGWGDPTKLGAIWNTSCSDAAESFPTIILKCVERRFWSGEAELVVVSGRYVDALFRLFVNLVAATGISIEELLAGHSVKNGARPISLFLEALAINAF